MRRAKTREGIIDVYMGAYKLKFILAWIQHRQRWVDLGYATIDFCCQYFFSSCIIAIYEQEQHFLCFPLFFKFSFRTCVLRTPLCPVPSPSNTVIKQNAKYATNVSLLSIFLFFFINSRPQVRGQHRIRLCFRSRQHRGRSPPIPEPPQPRGYRYAR